MAGIFDTLVRVRGGLITGLDQVVIANPSDIHIETARDYAHVTHRMFDVFLEPTVVMEPLVGLALVQILDLGAQSVERAVALQDWDEVLSETYKTLSTSRSTAINRLPGLSLSLLPGIPPWTPPPRRR